MQMVILGTLSLSGAAGVVAMRRKLLAVAQRLGMNTIRSTRLAAAASDHAKAAIKHGALELRVGLNRESASQELWVEFHSVERSPDRVLALAFDRVEPLVDGKGRGWRGCCSIPQGAAADGVIECCQRVIAEQGVEEL